uniref:Tumor necrosis factor receptor superfamily member 1B-like n=1 Tax=Acanthochromis polyacanthus TaxID=80966 RepID=A0A3Q1HTM1_9TELE
MKGLNIFHKRYSFPVINHASKKREFIVVFMLHIYKRDHVSVCGSTAPVFTLNQTSSNLITVFHIRSVNVSYSQPARFLPSILDSVQGNCSCLQSLDPPLENEQYSAHVVCCILSIICLKEAMKDILVLLVLLNAQTIKVCSQPYQADSDGNCRNKTTEYLPDGSNLCCKKCPPGHRQKEECTETTDSVCEQCPQSQYMERWNYAQNCLSCLKCKSSKGLQDAQKCSSTTKSMCICQPGRYCIMGFDDLYCAECRKYKSCLAGFGVTRPGAANSDVRCERCPSGTFSDSVSSTDRCQPHTNCDGGTVVHKGNATSDTVCEWQTSTKHFKTVFTTASTVMSTVATELTAPRGPRDSTQSASPPVSEDKFSIATKSPQPTTEPGSELAAVIAGVTGFLLFLIALMLLFICRQMRKKDAKRLQAKVDANGNCESAEKISQSQSYLGESQVTSFTVASPEQQCLLEKGEASSDHSQCSNNTETLTRTDGYSSHESISPLQSTLALDNPQSVLSEPMTLLSHMEPIPPQPSIPTQPSSQPTSPQIISPVTTSPQFNVNITLHIGGGSCGAPSIVPSDLIQPDYRLPYGEEESFGNPQQEAGKQSVMSVQESESYST